MFGQPFDEFEPLGFDRAGFDPRLGGMRMGRGSMEPAILGVLLKEPMHGYEVISTLETKSHGMWRPSPGSIYPTLQLLEEKGLVTSHESDGKKVYTVTEAGKEVAEQENEHFQKMWQNRELTFHDNRATHQELRTGMKLMRDIMHKGNKEQQQQLRAAIVDFIELLKQIKKGTM